MTSRQPDVLDPHRCELGEGPSWDAIRGELTWVDIPARAIHVLELATERKLVVETPSAVGAAVPTADGWLASLEPGPALIDRDGSVRELATYVDADGGAVPPTPMRSNDAKCDPGGRYWCGTMAWDKSRGAASLYRLDPGTHTLTPMLREVTISNGLGWSPDGSVMYFIDTSTRHVDVFDFDLETGVPTNRRVLVEIVRGEGWPDGLSVDAEGCVWVALWGGSSVRRYTPAGELDRTIDLPCSHVTSCAFVGPDLDRLAITTAYSELKEPEEYAGATFIADPGVSGLPVSRFGG